MIPKKYYKYFIVILILDICEVFCEEKSSLTFVIDDTSSMTEVINQVKMGVNSIFDAVLKSKESQIEDFVLVTFNDPDYPSNNKYASKLQIQTRNKTEFKDALSAIKPSGGGYYDCPEYALAGIEQGIRKSRPHSIIYIFTDASAKDYSEYERVKNLAIEHQSKLIFVLTGFCASTSERGYKVYQQLADSTSGQAISINPQDMKNVIDVMITDIKSFTTDLVDEKFSYGENQLPIWFDNENTSPKITVIGENPTLRIIGPDGRTPKIRTLMKLNTILVVEILNSTQGVYIVTIWCQSDYHVKVTAKTQVMFTHGFSTEKVKSIDYTTKRPLPDENSYIYIKVTQGNINLQTLTIIDDIKYRVPETMPLYILNKQENLYVTGYAPDLPEKFKLAITGIDPNSFENITRTGSLIEKQVHPDKAPVAVKKNSNMFVDYGTSTKLICIITAYPLPNITWNDSKEIKLASKDFYNKIETTSHVQIKNITVSNTYYCHAKNYLGEAVSTFNVSVKSPIIVYRQPKATTNSRYGTPTTITCNFASKYPLVIKWFHHMGVSVEREIYTFDDKYRISSNGTTLTILDTDLDLDGSYTCEASLKFDQNQRKQFTTEVHITDLSPPVLQNTASKQITINNTNKVTIPCKIVSGKPPPSVSWQVMRNGENVYSNLSAFGEELTLDNSALADAGHYRCIATNRIGKANKTIELVVQMAPEAAIDKGKSVTVPYGSTNVFKCRIVAYPLPTITWTDSKGHKLHSKDFITHHVITSQLEVNYVKDNDMYSCSAYNDLGRTEARIQVSVAPAIVLRTHPAATTYSRYRTPTAITCNFASKYPLVIKWFHRMSVSVEREIYTFDDKYRISSNGTTLTILDTALDLDGSYTCEASLKFDQNQRKRFTTEVHITDLSPPVLQNTASKQITINNTNKVTIPCKIVIGKPPPSVSWQVMRNGENVYSNLSAFGEELTLDNAALADAGQYRCIATNRIGKANKTTELVVQMAPEAAIDKGKSVTVPYGSTNVFKCRIVAYPLPTITWTDSKGHKLHSKDFITHHVITSQLEVNYVKDNDMYSCSAYNDLGRTEARIQVSVAPAIVLRTHPAATTYSRYRTPTAITCNFASKYPLVIKWFHRMSVSVEREIYTFDDKYRISSNGTTLTILDTDLDLDGSYTCEASLKYDQNQRKHFTTEVHITDLSPPVLQNTASKQITINNTNKVTIPCKIVSGKPPPSVSWQVMRNGENVYSNLSAFGEELTLDNAALADAGQYRCIATNRIGKANKTIELVVQMAPEAAIDKGKSVTVPYGSTNVFKCRIVAYPLPTITWTDSKGHKLHSKDFITHHVITSQLEVNYVKDNDMYSCSAYNDLGRTEARIQVSVAPAIVLSTHPAATTYSRYRTPTAITCNFASKYPLVIKWFHRMSVSVEREIYTFDDRYRISSNGTTLTILDTDLDLDGSYKCEASLKYDQNQRKRFTTEVHITDLSPPVLQNTATKQITINNTNKVTIPCKIVSGKPPPSVSWQVMRNGENVYSKLSAFGEEMTLDNAALADAGQYRCIATNRIGKANKTIELVVQMAPEAAIDKGKAVIVPYGSTNVFKCRIVAYPLPKIAWTDSKGHKLHSKDFNITDHVITSQLEVNNVKANEIYSCSAVNDLGRTETRIKVSVTPAIVLSTHPAETTGVRYKTTTTIYCDAKSAFPIQMKWFYQKSVNAGIKEIHTFDKYVITQDGSMLLIISTDLSHIGKYTCEASLVADKNEKISYTTKLEIIDLKSPEITASDKTITVMNGQKLEASCKASGVPEPNITWQFKGKHSNLFVDIPSLGEEVTNPSIGYEWAGSYKCTATNEVGSQNYTIEVVVHGEPKITNLHYVYSGVTGDKVLKIPCEITGIPEPTIIWKHGGKDITSDAKLTIDKNALLIKNPTENDTSNFTCEAKNKYGDAIKDFRAEISDFIDIDFIDLNTYIFLKLGESKDIKCNLPHSDPQSVRWYVNNDINFERGSSYSIRDAKYANDGNYTCRVNTDQGSESLNYVVDVGYEPKFIMERTSPIVTWHGNTKEMLDCNVDAKPREKAAWLYNGKALDSAETELYISGWGEYSCNVSNVHGSVLQTFNVTSAGCVINTTVDRVQNIPLLINDEPSTWPKLYKENEFIILKQKDPITLTCSTKDQPNNTFKTNPSATERSVECYKEDQFIVEGKILKFQDLECKDYVRSSLVLTKKPCMKNGEIIEVGFKLSNGFLGVYDICYSEADSRTLYTKVSMSDANVENIVGPSFKLNQRIKTGKHVGDILKCHYNQRRLVSPVDVAFGPAQISTLSDKYNAVPVHEPCEGSSRMPWSRVENIVYSVLKYQVSNFTLWTGASHYDANGIPRYLWKLARLDVDEFEAIVYVNVPNPESTDIVCSKHTSDTFSLPDTDRYTYSCSIGEFLEYFKLPSNDFGIILK